MTSTEPSRRILYLGLEIPPEIKNHTVIHCPLIQTIPRPKENLDIIKAFHYIKDYTHLIFTSKTSVAIFFEYISHFGISPDKLQKKTFIAVGTRTAGKIKEHSSAPILVANLETAEGIIDLLKNKNLNNSFLFWPHSALSRPILSNWLKDESINHHSCVFYDTIFQKPLKLPDPEDYDEIIFTSPSTVDAFINFFGSPPENKQLTFIGPITRDHWNEICLGLFI